MHNRVDALAEHLVLGGLAADVLIAHKLLAGHNDLSRRNCDVDIVELVALDHAGAIRGCLLHMDDSGVKLRGRNRDNLLARVEGILDIREL